MEHLQLPIGFAMALAMNAPAMEAFAAMPEPRKQELLRRAYNARSKVQMREIVSGIIGKEMP